jgi:hypothetical protein
MKKLQSTMLLLVTLGAFALSPGARADEGNQKTVFTFSGPVEIPGQVLPAGTYAFKLLDSHSNRHIVQVFSKDERRVFGTFLAIPDYRLRPSDKTIITFSERPAGSPEAIKGWFYPGLGHGHEFVYPKREAVVLARANNTPVPSIPEEVAVNSTKPAVTMREPEIVALNQAPTKAEEPGGEEVEVAAAFAVSDPALPATLPSTATTLSLAGLFGLFALGTAFALRVATAKAK